MQKKLPLVFPSTPLLNQLQILNYKKRSPIMSKTFKFFVLSAFALLLSIKSNAQSWPYIANESQLASATSSYTSITTADVTLDTAFYVAVPHVAFTESGIIKVKRLIDDTWENVGGSISAGSASYTYLFSDDNGKLYLNYVDVANGNKLAVKTYNQSSNTWEALGGNSANLYLSTGTIIQNVGSQANPSHNSWMAFDSNNIPYVIFSEFSNGGVPYVKKFNGTSWETVGSGSISADKAVAVGITINQTTNIPYVAYVGGTGTTGTLKAFSFSNNTWNSIDFPTTTVTSGSNTYTTINGATSGAITASRHSSIVLDNNNNINIAYFNAGNSNKATVIKYDVGTSTWSLSGVVSTRDASYLSITRSQSGNLYTSYVDAITNGSGRTVGKVMELLAGTTTWSELIESTAAAGIDEPVSNISAAASSTGVKYVIYTKTNSSSVVTPVLRSYSPLPPPPPVVVLPDEVVTTPKQMEYLTRGVVAVRINTSQVLVSWRLFGTDSTSISFNVYRNGIKLNSTPITNSTNYLDNTSANSTYTVKSVMNGVEGNETTPVSTWATNFMQIPIQQPVGGTTPDNVGFTYNANDASVGDVDGDGEYEIILKWDPSNSKDNSFDGYTGDVFIDCYKLNGTRLWRINLGKNMRAGAHYDEFQVFDFDGDGKAEIACKTADGTIDGTGVVIGSSTADYRSSVGRVLSGPEYLTMFNGLTGKAMSTVNYLPARGNVADWGDGYGNRVDRFISAVAYLDGQHPSLIMGRGYYTRLVRAAWDFKNGALQLRWIFDSNDTGNSAYFGQGNHQLSIADVDGDGKQEIINGASVINDNGKGLWSSGKGHGDALHVTDMDPTTPELEEWMNYESPTQYTPYGLRFTNAKTGETLWGITTTGDVGRSMAADMDPQYPGYEMWGSSGGNVYTNKGVSISTSVPSYNFGIWWDGDLSRELLDGTKLDKWNYLTKSAGRLYTIYNAAPISSNNSTKSNPCLTADILGDWREEMLFRATDNQSLYLFTTPYVTDKRIYTLMHDPQYRVAVAWQNSGYNQPPYPSFFLGNDMAAPPKANIYTVNAAALPIKLLEFKAKPSGNQVALTWKTVSEANNKLFTVERSIDGKTFEEVLSVNGAGNSSKILNYSAVDYTPLAGTSYYRLRQTDYDGTVTYSNISAVNILKTDDFKIYPNPATDVVKIQLSSTNTALHLSLNSIDGKLLLQTTGNLENINTSLNTLISTISPGIYYVTIKDAQKVYSQKLIKK